MKADKISIVIPIYNVKNYLKRSVNSVVNQSYPDIEIILVDDGSTDGCDKLCDELVSIYRESNDIKVIHKENGGLSSARNAGLEVASGRYIMFIDSDDYIDDMMAEQLHELLVRSKSDMSICSYVRVDEQETTLSKCIINDEIIDIGDDTDKMEFVLRRFLEYNVTWEAWNKLYDMEIIKKNALRFRPNKEIFSEDLCFNMEYLICCKQIITSSYEGYFYVQRSDSIMGSNKKVYHIEQHIELGSVIKNEWKKHIDSIYEDDFEKKYALIFYMIMHPEYLKMKDMDVTQIKELINGLADKEIILAETKGLIKEWKSLIDYYGIAAANVKLDFARKIVYAIEGKACLPRVRSFLYQKFLVAKSYCNIVAYVSKNIFKKKVYLIGTEDFGNLGDHMIAEAEVEDLKKKYPNFQLIEITASQFGEMWEKTKNKISKNSPIYLTGGGNFGDVYPLAEKIRRTVISQCPQNSITIFPQTIYYEDAKEMEKTKEIINAHKNLTIQTREKVSYEFARKNYNCAVELVQDIVLSYSGEITQNIDTTSKRGVLFCVRNDKESKMGLEKRKQLLCECRKNGELVLVNETQKSYCISKESRKKALRDYMILLACSNRVITDRLHGMIFSVITNTPCEVYGNYNHKVKGCFDMMEDKGGVKYYGE